MKPTVPQSLMKIILYLKQLRSKCRSMTTYTCLENTVADNFNEHSCFKSRKKIQLHVKHSNFRHGVPRGAWETNIEGSPERCEGAWRKNNKYNQWSFLVPLIGGRYHWQYIPLIYHLYIAYWVILYITYHLLREPETAIDTRNHFVGIFSFDIMFSQLQGDFHENSCKELHIYYIQ